MVGVERPAGHHSSGVEAVTGAERAALRERKEKEVEAVGGCGGARVRYTHRNRTQGAAASKYRRSPLGAVPVPAQVHAANTSGAPHPKGPPLLRRCSGHHRERSCCCCSAWECLLSLPLLLHGAGGGRSSSSSVFRGSWQSAGRDACAATTRASP